jgi:hypothetical protein
VPDEAVSSTSDSHRSMARLNTTPLGRLAELAADRDVVYISPERACPRHAAIFEPRSLCGGRTAVRVDRGRSRNRGHRQRGSRMIRISGPKVRGSRAA